MKTSHLIPLMLAMMLFPTFVIGQEIAQPSDPSDVSVLEKSWHKEGLNQGRNQNPLAPNEEYLSMVRAQKAVIKRRDDSLPNQTTEERMPVPTPRPLPARTAPSITYVYKIKVKNTGSKIIKAIFWDYEFLDPDTQEVMGRRRIASRAKFAPGKIYELDRRFGTPPTRLVSADKLDKKYRDQFTERVTIHRINYADGTVWQRAP
jgi:hypothetical protein